MDLQPPLMYVLMVSPTSPGQHNDSRMNLAIALTAAREGAHVANHLLVISLIKEKTMGPDGEEKEAVRGARVMDMLTGKEWDIRAKVVINATGVFVCVCVCVFLYVRERWLRWLVP